jgi:Na+-driven multidrug efflux pump
MTFEKSRNILGAVFLLCCLISLVSLMVFFKRYVPDYLTSDQAIDLAAKIISLYLINLSIISTGYFGQGSLREGNVSKGTFWIALFFSVLWNLVVLGGLRIYCGDPRLGMSFVDSFISKIIMPVSVIVSAALAYFFTANVSNKATTTTKP